MLAWRLAMASREKALVGKTNLDKHKLVMASELANSVVMETAMVSRVWEWYKSGQEKT